MHKTTYQYLAKLEPDPEGGFQVTFPDVPEAITGGADEAEALANASEALGLALRGILQDGRPLPSPGAKGRDLVPVAIDPDTAFKLAVIEAFKAAGISKSELARRIGRGETEARRILDPDHPTGLALMKAALAALGKTAVVSVMDAA
ncbi:type II toxin-antitoxin system HicB family antitoxin [Mesorhizobium sp. CA4]|uniref:type II toxin-antitoxin system HicB family antitoxin n=1 Tax=Mesorhizobium sp. CA4 TaxID=588499 RepID=UPI001CD10D0F|nr:type II toxin-antitoxin system HicB family antitoxin [Mesorhizobium sp. CA4]MBZ9822319.1 type II toxin-antitoxin system HicB family antitoxin [Mesorhizobium sp. CA4]